MTIYFVLIGIACLFCFVDMSPYLKKDVSKPILVGNVYKVKLVQNKKRCFVFLLAFSVFFVIAFRDFSVGADTQRYVQIFTEKLYGTGWHIFKARLDWGYTIVNNLCGLFMNPRMYIVFIALIFTIMNTKFYSVYTSNFYLSIILYITIGTFSLNMTGLRQSFAICITYVAFYFATRSKLLPFVAMVAVATLFHTSAIGFLIIYPLMKIKRAYLPQVTSILIVAAGGLFCSKIVVFLVNTLNLEKYKDLVGQQGINLKCFIFYFLVVCLCAIICLYENKCMTQEQTRCFVLASVALFCFALAPNIYLFDRMAHYFIPYLIVFASNVLSSMKERTSRVLVMLGMIGICCVWFGVSSIGGSYFIDNYRFGL